VLDGRPVSWEANFDELIDVRKSSCLLRSDVRLGWGLVWDLIGAEAPAGHGTGSVNTSTARSEALATVEWGSEITRLGLLFAFL